MLSEEREPCLRREKKRTSTQSIPNIIVNITLQWSIRGNRVIGFHPFTLLQCINRAFMKGGGCQKPTARLLLFFFAMVVG